MRTFRSLRHRNYRLYFAGQLVSLVGSWMQMAVLAWLAHEYTHQSRWPSFLAAVQIGPTLLLGPLGGWLADRVSKRGLIIRTQFGFLCCALALLTLYKVGLLNEWVMLLVMLAHGIVQAIDLPTRLAYVPSLVGRDDLSNAVALNSLLFNVARAIGPALAGLLYELGGAGPCFIANALSYLAIIVALCLIRPVPEAASLGPELPPVESHSWSRRPGLRSLLMVVGLVAIGGWPLLALLPSFADNVLDRGQEGYSSLLSSVGVGALGAALTAATIGNEVRRKVVLLGGLMVAMIGMIGLTSTSSLTVAAISCVLFGYGVILFFATGQTLVQLSSNDADRGKVMGLWAMIMSAGVPVGNLVFGPLADAIASVPNVIAMQAGLIAVAGMILLTRRVE